MRTGPTIGDAAVVCAGAVIYFTESGAIVRQQDERIDALDRAQVAA